MCQAVQNSSNQLTDCKFVRITKIPVTWFWQLREVIWNHVLDDFVVLWHLHFYFKCPKIERFHFRFLSHAIWAFHITSCTVVKSMSKIGTATVWRLTQMDGNLTKLLMRRKKCWWNCFGTNLRHFSKFSLWLSIHSGILTCLSIWYTDLTTEWPKKRI